MSTDVMTLSRAAVSRCTPTAAAASVAVPAGDAVQPQLQPVLHRVARPRTGHLSFRRVTEDRTTVGLASAPSEHVLRVLQPSHEVSSLFNNTTYFHSLSSCVYTIQPTFVSACMTTQPVVQPA